MTCLALRSGGAGTFDAFGPLTAFGAIPKIPFSDWMDLQAAEALNAVR